jgi:hypothetical protein
VHQFLPAAEFRNRRIPASSQVHLLDALRRMTGAGVGERDDARRDRHLTDSKSSDDFGARMATAVHAARTPNVKPSLEATRFDRFQNSLRAGLRHVESEDQSA